MNFDRYAGMASAVGIVLTLTLIVWLGIAGPIWRAYWSATPDQWLSFAGSVLGGFMTLAAAIVAWFAVQVQIGEQRRSTEMQRRDTAENALTQHAAAIFSVHNEYGQIPLVGVEDRYDQYKEFEAVRCSGPVISTMIDPVIGKDHEAIGFLMKAMHNDALSNFQKPSETHPRHEKTIIPLLYEDVLRMIGERRRIMRKGTVDDLTNIRVIKLAKYRRAIIDGKPLFDRFDDED
jgi:hypothetical protein